jgi:hypothetical protein
MKDASLIVMGLKRKMARNGRRSRKVNADGANAEPALVAESRGAGDLGDTIRPPLVDPKSAGLDTPVAQSDLLAAVKTLTASIDALTSALADAKMPSDKVGHAERSLFSYAAAG